MRAVGPTSFGQNRAASSLGLSQHRSRGPIRDITTRRRRPSPGPPHRLLVLTLVGVIAAVLVVRAALGSKGFASSALSVVGVASSAFVPNLKPAEPRPVSVKAQDLPGGMAPGTCLDYNPTGPDRRLTVFVDPGHGGPDPGGVGIGLREKDVTLAVGLKVRDRLRADGFHVVMSRVADTAVAKLADSQVVNGAITAGGVHVDTIARIDCANSSGAKALLAIHFNAFQDPGASGSEIFYDDVRDFSPQSLLLATDLDHGLQSSFTASGWQVYDRGVLSDADTGASGLTSAADAYGRLMEIGPAQPGWNNHPSKMPGALVEPFFLTAPAEAAVVGSEGGQRAVAKGLEQGLLTFFAPPPSPAPSPAARATP
jgi:N-acetylmuramoyl-L-alanine amidase